MTLSSSEYEIAELLSNAVPERHRLDLDLSRLPMNDYGNGQRLVQRFRDKLLHVDGIGWHVWDSTHWSKEAGEQEATKLAHRAAQLIWSEAAALHAYLEAQRERSDEERPDARSEHHLHKRVGALRAWAIDSGNSSRIRAMLAAALPYMRVTPQQMNADPFAFNCQNGTLFFERPPERGGPPKITFKRHNPADRISMVANVPYDPAATCEEFRATVEFVLPNEEVSNFLQELFGYCLTGDTSEQLMALLVGEGSNGKSTIVDAIRHTLGSYAVTTPIETFMEAGPRKGGDASPDIARLPGRRMVAASESEQNMRFSEGLVKRLTGGDNIAARALYEREMIEFKAAFKIVLFLNSKPVIRGQDHGIWRRMRIVPFDVTITEEQKDKELPARLEREGPGILNWMLDGLRVWLSAGLSKPQAVMAATEEYRAESDPIGQFAREMLIRREHATVPAARMYSVYVKWCNANALEPRNRTAFGRRMTALHFEKETMGTVFYLNVELVRDDFDDRRSDDPPPQERYDGPQ